MSSKGLTSYLVSRISDDGLVSGPAAGAADFTALVIRALGMVVGKIVKEEGGISGISGIKNKRFFILTKLITAASQMLLEAQEMDINLNLVNSRRIAHILKKLRLVHAKQSKTGNRGWLVSLDDLYRWSRPYGLDIEEITGIEQLTQDLNATHATNATNATPKAATRCEGEL